MKIKEQAEKAINLSKEIAALAGEWDKDIAGKPVKAKEQIKKSYDEAVDSGIFNTAIEVIGEYEVYKSYSAVLSGVVEKTKSDEKEE